LSNQDNRKWYSVQEIIDDTHNAPGEVFGHTFAKRNSDQGIYTYIDSNVWRFDESMLLDRMVTWSTLPLAKNFSYPDLREYGLAITDNNILVLHGGYLGQFFWSENQASTGDNKVQNQLFTLDLTSDELLFRAAYWDVQVGGPSVMFSLGGDYVLLFNPNLPNSILLLDIGKQTSTSVIMEGVTHFNRIGFGISSVNDSDIIIYGGQDGTSLLDVDVNRENNLYVVHITREPMYSNTFKLKRTIALASTGSLAFILVVSVIVFGRRFLHKRRIFRQTPAKFEDLGLI
jgi:hypothetical protein